MSDFTFISDTVSAFWDCVDTGVAPPIEYGSITPEEMLARYREVTAKKRHLISYNPAEDLDLPAASRPKVKPWEPEELGTFLDSAVQDTMGAIFETIAATAARRGEVLGLRWSDVDMLRSRAVLREQVLHIAGPQPCAYCGGATSVPPSGRLRPTAAHTAASTSTGWSWVS